MPAEPAAVRRPARRRRSARRAGGGGAADRPLPRDHRDPPLRRPRLAGAGARRPHGRSPTTPAATASPTPPRRARVMDTRSWSATWSGRRGDRWARAASSSPATRWAPTRRSPTRCAHPERAGRAGRDRAGLRGRDLGRVAASTGTAWPTALESGGVDGFVAYIDRAPGDRPAPGATRCCASPASGCCATAIPRRWSTALREVPRSRPFESLAELEALEVPALVVASHDDADPGPSLRGGAEAYARARCRGRGWSARRRGSRRWPGRAGGSRARSPLLRRQLAEGARMTA